MQTLIIILICLSLWYAAGVYIMKMIAAWVDNEAEQSNPRGKPSEYISNQEIFVLAIFGPGILVILFLLMIYAMLLDNITSEE